MRKQFLLLLLLSITSLFGQKLKFDVMAEYDILEEKSFFKKSAYKITDNDRYIMQVLNQYDGKQIAEVFDLISLKKHLFTIKETKTISGLITYDFQYIKTRPFERSPIKNIYFDFIRISIEDNIERVELIFYRNKSKSKIAYVLDLKILKSEVNFFPLFRFVSLHPSEFITDLNYSNGGLVTSCTSRKGPKKTILKAFQEVNLQLMIPTESLLVVKKY
ncbi:hypothetical protein [Flavobacterium sp. GSP14]|uniref:hypothetical protein n=1 Tax=Flavobacterium sp. GSP14 TaxID=3401734 RepID=UPI003AAD0E15